MNINGSVSYFPSQKISTKEKDFKWVKECADALTFIALYDADSGIREQRLTKQTNYNLMNNILNPRDIERTMNPWKLTVSNFPADMRNYPLVKPKIDLLVGEELKRKFDWRVIVTNQDAVSRKEQEIAERIKATFTKLVLTPNAPEEQVKAELDALKPLLSMNYADMRERRADQYLRYLYKSLNLSTQFNRGFEDFLIASEEIYNVEIVSGEPVLRRCNPLNVSTVRSGESPYIEDADVIIEQGYFPLGWIIDNYYEYLTEAEIKDIESGSNVAGSSPTQLLNYVNNNPIPIMDSFGTGMSNTGIIEVNTTATKTFGGDYDNRGNYRVTKLNWRSLRKIGKWKHYDEAGDEVYDWVDENFKIDKSLGEEITWSWVNEWWECTRLGSRIYVKYGPREVQVRSMDNPSKCFPAYTGTAYNINSNRAMSLVDVVKPYQYLYNTLMYRTDLAFAKTKGKIGSMPLHLIPDGWDIDKWLYYAETMNWAVFDAFKSSNEGVAAGKLSGNMNQLPPVIDLEMGQYIQQHLGMIAKIEDQVDQFTGVSRQRQGQINTSELVGNVERATMQSSHITEKWFALHENTKLRALTNLLEHAKVAWRGRNKKLVYVTDELTTAMIDMQGDDFAENEYGLFLSNSVDDMELLSVIKGAIPQLLQSQKASLSQIFTLYDSTSISEKRRKFESIEQHAEEVTAQSAQAQQDVQMQIAQQELEFKKEELQLKREELELRRYEIDLRANVEIEKATLTAQIGMLKIENDRDKDGIPDELEEERIRIMNADKEMKNAKTMHDMSVAKRQQAHIEEMDKKKLELQERKLEIDKLKAKQKPKSK